MLFSHVKKKKTQAEWITALCLRWLILLAELYTLSLTLSHLEELFQEIRKKIDHFYSYFTHIHAWLAALKKTQTWVKYVWMSNTVLSGLSIFYLLIFFSFHFYSLKNKDLWWNFCQSHKKSCKKSLPCHSTASAKFTGNGCFTAYWAYVQSWTYSLCHAAKNKMGANRRPWDFLCDTLNLVWGYFWASCGHRDLPGSVCVLVQLEHVSLRLLGSWNTLIIGHPSAKCCYQSVISCLWPAPPPMCCYKILLLDSV